MNSVLRGAIDFILVAGLAVSATQAVPTQVSHLDEGAHAVIIQAVKIEQQGWSRDSSPPTTLSTSPASGAATVTPGH